MTIEMLDEKSKNLPVEQIRLLMGLTKYWLLLPSDVIV